MKTGICFFLLLGTGLLARAQDDLPDTLWYFYPEPVKILQANDTILKRTFYSISDPDIRFYDLSNYSFDNKIMMAVKRDSVFLVFDLFSGGVSVRENVKFERVDLDGKGSRELVIRWKDVFSHMCATYSNRIESRGVQVWNPDSLFLYFEYENYCNQKWEESPEEPGGQRKSSSLNEPESETNFNHTVLVKPGRIDITCNKKLSTGSSSIINLASYRLSEKYLLRKRYSSGRH